MRDTPYYLMPKLIKGKPDYSKGRERRCKYCNKKMTIKSGYDEYTPYTECYCTCEGARKYLELRDKMERLNALYRRKKDYIKSKYYNEYNVRVKDNDSYEIISFLNI